MALDKVRNYSIKMDCKLTFFFLKKKLSCDFPGGPVAKRLSTANAGAQVQSLAKELDPTCHN